jgi:hypothetical protein
VQVQVLERELELELEDVRHRVSPAASMLNQVQRTQAPPPERPWRCTTAISHRSTDGWAPKISTPRWRNGCAIFSLLFIASCVDQAVVVTHLLVTILRDSHGNGWRNRAEGLGWSLDGVDARRHLGRQCAGPDFPAVVEEELP